MKKTRRIMMALAAGLTCFTLSSCGGGGGGGFDPGHALTSLDGKVMTSGGWQWEFQGNTVYVDLAGGLDGDGSYTYQVTGTDVAVLDIPKVRLSNGETYSQHFDITFSSDRRATAVITEIATQINGDERKRTVDDVQLIFNNR